MVTSAIYKGDEFIYLGNKDECAKFLNVEPNTIYFISSATYMKRIKGSNNRLIAIKVEEEEE
jgi:hypothetical protein